MLDKKTISAFVEQQVPDFVRENHGTFVDFIEAYYEWLETSENPYLTPYQTLTYKDINNTIPVFLAQLQNEVMQLWPKRLDSDIDKKNLIKNIKQFYESKGTEKSIRFVFRVLFGKEINITYPRDNMLLASDGKWQEPTSLKITNTNGKFNSLGGVVVSQKKPINEVPIMIPRPLNLSEKAFAEVGFNCVIDVFGVKVFAHSTEIGTQSGDFVMARIASCLAQLLDNDSDGEVDNQTLIDNLKAKNTSIFLIRNEASYDDFNVEKVPAGTNFFWIDLPIADTGDPAAHWFDTEEVGNLFDLTNSTPFTLYAPYFEYVVGRLLDILLTAGYSTMSAFQLGSTEYDPSVSLSRAYGEVNNFEEYTGVPSTEAEVNATCEQFEGLPVRTFKVQSLPVAEFPEERTGTSFVSNQKYYFCTGLMMYMGFYELVADDDSERYQTGTESNTESAESRTPWGGQSHSEKSVFSNQKWMSVRNFSSTRYSAGSYSSSKGGTMPTFTTASKSSVASWVNTQQSATASGGSIPDPTDQELYGTDAVANAWLLDQSWGNFTERSDLRRCNDTFVQLIEEHKLPTVFPTGWYRPTKNNSIQPDTEYSVSTARVIATQNYKIPPITGFEIFLDDIVGEFDGNYPIEFTIGGVEYQESMYHVFSGVGLYNKGLRYEVEDTFKLDAEQQLTTTKNYEPEIGLAPLASVTTTFDGVGGLATVDEVGANGEIEKVRVTNFGIDYSSWRHNFGITSTYGVFARGTILVDWVCNYSGYWLNDDGKTSSIKRIRDNERWHEYAYVIESDMTLDKFKESLYRLTHPGGTAVFGDIVIDTSSSFSYENEAAVLVKETPLIGNYLPYTFQTQTNLRAYDEGQSAFPLAGRQDDSPTDDTGIDTDEVASPQVDLYPDGFNPNVGTVSETGSTAHNPYDTDLTDGSDGPIDDDVENIFFDNVPPISDSDSINNYWVVYPHPYTRLTDVTTPEISQMSILNFIETTISEIHYDNKNLIPNRTPGEDILDKPK